MKRKIYDGSITDALATMYNGKYINLEIGAHLFLMSLYALMGFFVVQSNGLSYEDNIRFINTVVGALVLVPNAILFKNLKLVCKEKDEILKIQQILDVIKKELGLNEINDINLVRCEDEINSRRCVMNVVLSDKQGNIAHLKEVKSFLETECETFIDEEDISRKTLK